MMRKLKMFCGLFLEISFIVITWNPKSNCACLNKNHFIPMQYIDVTRTAHTSLDVLLEKKYWRLLERGWRKRIVWCLDRLHKIHVVERKATWRIYMVRWSEETYEETNNVKTRQYLAGSVEAYVWCSEMQSKTRVDCRETKARSCQTMTWYLPQWNWGWIIQTHYEKRS